LGAAEQFFERGLQFDPLAEPLYRDLPGARRGLHDRSALVNSP
jgi:hypothetical protein